jgi:DnaJ-class molecular chaperone
MTDQKWIMCLACEGTGKDVTTFGVAVPVSSNDVHAGCPECDGSGRIRIQLPERRYPHYALGSAN